MAKKITVFFGTLDCNCVAEDVIQQLQESIIQYGKGNVLVSLEENQYNSGYSVQLYRTRDETPAETAKREQQEKQMKHKAKARDLQFLRALQEKYKGEI